MNIETMLKYSKIVIKILIGIPVIFVCGCIVIATGVGIIWLLYQPYFWITIICCFGLFQLGRISYDIGDSIFDWYTNRKRLKNEI